MIYCKEPHPFINIYLMMSINQIEKHDHWEIDNCFYPKAIFYIDTIGEIEETTGSNWRDNPCITEDDKQINISEFLLLL